MSQTIYRTKTSNLTILKVEEKDVAHDGGDNPKEASDSNVEDHVGVSQHNKMNSTKSGNKLANSVTWDESTIDNEMMNRKKSKKCCIFHKKRDFGESSSSSDDESDSDNTSEDDKCIGGCASKRCQ
ncbi:hypothetical protein OIY81_3521 [Cryptosporidium canis]|uniref:Protein phosphatase inhibitor n=1 Tax=Cryptosporidium canis TaxID=195482 RepID=A0ABQ8PBB0_9CRYT|nr:hypothetical protein OIY81_3521 [Cryptosporidium canis]KAJ1612191.1 hypothetical protein OJ252_1295 [Cryptosporidium canis]